MEAIGWDPDRPRENDTRDKAKAKNIRIMNSPTKPEGENKMPPTGEMPEVESVAMACISASKDGTPEKVSSAQRARVSPR